MGVSATSFPLGMSGSSRKEMAILFLIHNEQALENKKRYFPKLSSPFHSLICEAQVLRIIHK